MSNLQLVTTEKFGDIDCNFYRNMNDEILLTREQIGSALEYSSPRQAIETIHKKHKDRLDELSVVTKLMTTDGKQYNTYLYSQKGIMEICRWSRQSKANQFMDWCWDIIEKYRHGSLDVNSDNKMVLSIVLEMQKQANKTNELLINLLTSSKPKEIYQPNTIPAWTNKMFPKFMKIREHYYPEDVECRKFTNTFRKIFSDFNEMYGSELLAQTVDDFCYQNNCLKCNTMDALAYTPEVRKVMEVFIDSMIVEIENNKVLASV